MKFQSDSESSCPATERGDDVSFNQGFNPTRKVPALRLKPGKHSVQGD